VLASLAACDHPVGAFQTRGDRQCQTASTSTLARALIAGRTLDDAAIRDIELTRARRALAYLKAKIGNAAMRDLLKDDIDQTQARNREWVETSGGQWKSGSLELVVPGPGAAAFHGYFMTMMKEDRQPELRAGHPEHFMNVPLGPHAATAFTHLISRQD